MTALDLLNSNSEADQMLMRPVSLEMANFVLESDLTITCFDTSDWYNESTQDYSCQIFALNFARLNLAKAENTSLDADPRPMPTIIYIFMGDIESYGLAKFSNLIK